jgi:hypothetical protein
LTEVDGVHVSNRDAGAEIDQQASSYSGNGLIGHDQMHSKGATPSGNLLEHLSEAWMLSK